MDLGLRGKHVFIAGASRGIGEAMSAAFLAEGANVTLTARTKSKLDETSAALGRAYPTSKIFSFAGDMTKTADIERALIAAETELGPFHTVIGNVGIDDNIPLGFDVSDEDWDKGIDQNFLGGVRLARKALKMIFAHPPEKRVGANLILITSIAGVQAYATRLPYSTMKAGLNHLTRELSKMVGSSGVRVNGIAPGNILFPGGTWEAFKKDNADFVEKYLKREVAMQRFGTPKEIADAAIFVASERATFLTGEILVVDGGQVR